MPKQYPKVTVKDVFNSYWEALRVFRGTFALTIFLIVTATIFDIVSPLYYRTFFNILNTATDKASAGKSLLGALLMILFLNLCSWVCYRAATFANAKFQIGGIAKLRQQGFNYLLNHSYTFFANNFTGSLTQRINRYARAFERLCDRVVWNVIPLLVRILGIALIVWFIKPAITWVIIIWVALFITFNYFFARYKDKYDKKKAEMDSKATAVLSDAITNHNTIQLFAGYGRETDRYRGVTDEQAAVTRFAWNMDGVMEAIQALLIIFMEFLLFFFSIKYWQAGTITLGTFVLFQSYLIGLGGRLWDFSRVVRDFYEGFSDAEELVEMLKLPHEIKDLPGAKDFVFKKGEVSFQKVSFSFNETRTVLDDINMTIDGGQKVALIGPSGAGKSTIVRLLLRFYEVGKGTIFIDGQDVKYLTQDSLHNAISLVPQDPILFHRTLMENIRYGKKGATNAEVIEAARLAHCHEFIDDLPKRYDTYVGERGIKLSGGERQRVAIARAILKNAPILILDEATSSLDSYSEMLIQDALVNLMKGKTTIVIAHRLSTIRKMDRIIVVKDGSILEEGTHKELLKKDESLYKKLWELQAGGFISAEI